MPLRMQQPAILIRDRVDAKRNNIPASGGEAAAKQDNDHRFATTASATEPTKGGGQASRATAGSSFQTDQCQPSF